MPSGRSRFPSALIAGCLTLLWTCGWAPVISRAPAEDIPLRVMTFNLRYASASPPNAWAARRPVMRECIRSCAPDLMGTQEGLYPQLKDLAADLPGYEWIGLGREGGSKGEYMAVFYRTDRFEPMAYDHFWLSDTPAVIGSSTWGNTNRRMVTLVRFRERRTLREFYFWNTHLDNAVELARQKGAALIVERADQLMPVLPLILTGDFNAAAGSSPTYDILVKNGSFSDTWALAGERINETLNTFHGFAAPVHSGSRIDWILTRGPVGVQKIEIVTCSAGGQYPSDHFPVLASLTLSAGK